MAAWLLDGLEDVTGLDIDDDFEEAIDDPLEMIEREVRQRVMVAKQKIAAEFEKRLAGMKARLEAASTQIADLRAQIEDGIQDAKQYTAEKVQATKDAVVAEWTEKLDAMKEKFDDAVEQAQAFEDTMKSKVAEAAKMAQEKIASVKERASERLHEMKEAALKVVEQAKEQAQAKLDEAKEMLKEKLASAFELATSFKDSVMEKIKSATASVTEAVRDTVEAVKTFVKDGCYKVLDRTMEFVREVVQTRLKPPNIPALHANVDELVGHLWPDLKKEVMALALCGMPLSSGAELENITAERTEHDCEDLSPDDMAEQGVSLWSCCHNVGGLDDDTDLASDPRAVGLGESVFGQYTALTSSVKDGVESILSNIPLLSDLKSSIAKLASEVFDTDANAFPLQISDFDPELSSSDLPTSSDAGM